MTAVVGRVDRGAVQRVRVVALFRPVFAKKAPDPIDRLEVILLGA